MSSGARVLERVEEAEYVYDIEVLAGAEEEATWGPNLALSDDWRRPDPIDELLAQLADLGRENEAEVISRVLRGGAEDSELLRTLASISWAEDWDSIEDRAYDQL